MLKCECEAYGYTVRTARKWLEMAGASVYPAEGDGSILYDPFDGDDESDS